MPFAARVSLISRSVLISALVALLSPQSAGATPQTARPVLATATAQLGQRLFIDIVDNDETDAQRLFFPEAAYVQLKAISYPAGDYHNRLMANFRADFAAYHRLFVRASALRYVGTVYRADAEGWVPPGACYNNLGYWHEPGIRLVYKQNGVEKSFGVFSLISWLGVYYVVHLGPNLFFGDPGEIDAPALGPGVPAGPGSC